MNCFFEILDLQKHLRSCPLLEDVLDNFEKVYEAVGDEDEALQMLIDYYKEKGDYV